MNAILADFLIVAGRLLVITTVGVLMSTFGQGSDSPGSSYSESPHPRDHANKNAKFYKPTGTSRGYGRRSY